MTSRNPSRFEREVEWFVLLAFVIASALAAGSAQAQKKWQDPENATFGEEVTLSNSDDGRTTEFGIDARRSTINWQDLQQPSNNTLVFTFADESSRNAVLNYISATHPSNLNGTVTCDSCTVAFANPYGVYVGGEAVLDVGNLALIAGEINQGDFMSGGAIQTELTGVLSNAGTIRADGNVVLLGREIRNTGSIEAQSGVLLGVAGSQVNDLDWDVVTDQFLGQLEFAATLSSGSIENSGLISGADAGLFSPRVINHGQIQVKDGSLLIVAADAVSLRRFDDPISINLPNAPADRTARDAETPLEYAIANSGEINAGLGHVRLSAADPLGYGIRQGTGGHIAGNTIEIAGGEQGRVQLSGSVDASEGSDSEIGGTIDITGSIIALADAKIDASGTRGGGAIQIGGEQQGGGDLQRARAVIIDETSEVRADAIESGDGGRVIVFSEGLTAIDGKLFARGGARGGDGGFIETSGLAQIVINETPDVSAPNGSAGSWLIDPFDITVVRAGDLTDCDSGNPDTCLNSAIDAILDPEFDDAVFDGIIRSFADSKVDAEVIAKALAVGTNVTLSTEAFKSGGAGGTGNITIDAPILIPNTNVSPSIRAGLILLAANDIIVNENIIAGTTGERSNLSLDLTLTANDVTQTTTSAFTYDKIRGDVVLNADIDTGGGQLFAEGVSIHQAAGTAITTQGGNLTFRSGTLDRNSDVSTIKRKGSAPGIRATDPQPEAPFRSTATTGYAPVAITIEGTIDTSNDPSLSRDSGGNVSIAANSANVSSRRRTAYATGLLKVSDGASITTGGGSITLTSGLNAARGTSTAGNIAMGGSLNSCADTACTSGDVGGRISLEATRVSPTKADFVEADVALPDRGEGGSITITDATGASKEIQTGGATLAIGGANTQSVSIDGELDTTNDMNVAQNGLLNIFAFNQLAVNADSIANGDGDITIGANAATTLSSAGIYIEGRSVTTSNAGGANPVLFEASGRSTATFDNADTTGTTTGTASTTQTTGTTGDGTAVVDTLSITGRQSIDFGANTKLEAQDVVIAAATQPTALTDAERAALAAPTASLSFGGLNGSGNPDTAGVRINAKTVQISVGDGTTAGTDLFDPNDLLHDPTNAAQGPSDFALSRGAYGTYAGLQLRDLAGVSRTEELTIAQDRDFTISTGAASDELDLGFAFDTAANGTNGMDLTLESSDGVLTVGDTTGLNGAGSIVTLNGGLALVELGMTPIGNTVVLGDGVNPFAGTARFTVDELTVSSPKDFAVNAQIADSLDSVDQLTFEAGRNTGVTDVEGKGTLTINDATNPVILHAAESLTLHGGASGFGDLDFGPSQPITLQANEITLQAGGGAGNQNSESATFSKIVDLKANNVSIMDADGNALGTAAAPTSFHYEQDAAIDAAQDLPEITQFGLTALDGFRDARDVEYRVISNEGAIDLSQAGSNGGDRFRDSALTLIGTGATPIEIDSNFSFQGDRVTLGGTSGFVFTQALANAFNRSGVHSGPNTEMTLLAGRNEDGNLSFAAGQTVIASRINLRAGDGIDGDTGSAIKVGSTMFDLSSATLGSRTFTYHQDNSSFDLSDLPETSQFVGGQSNAPDILAIRSDSGSLDLANPDLKSLPVNLGGPIARVILEADSITLLQTDGSDLDLVPTGGPHLRLRANTLELGATGGVLESSGAQVLAGTTGPGGTLFTDTQLDGEALLIEAFDVESTETDTRNLSSLSADPNSPGDFDLDAGRGPTTFAISQNGSVAVANLPDRDAISGRLARTRLDIDDDPAQQIATNYQLTSIHGTVAIAPEKVDGSSLSLDGDSGTDLADKIKSSFDFGVGTYKLDGLVASTNDSIEIKNGTNFEIAKLFSLTAGGLTRQPSETVTTSLGEIRFGTTGARDIDLLANQIRLTVGVPAALLNPDDEPVDNAFLPQADLSGLDNVTLNLDADGSAEGSFFQLSQNATIDLASDVDADGIPDNLEALDDGFVLGTPKWDSFNFETYQSDLNVAGFDELVGLTENAFFAAAVDAPIVANLESQSVFFDDFDGNVVFRSNDITLMTDQSGTQLNLDAPNLELRGTAVREDTTDLDSRKRGQLRRSETALARAKVTIKQVDAFDATARLPRLAQYTRTQNVFDARGNASQATLLRASLRGVDLQLETTGPDTLTFNDTLRDRTRFANLILRSAGDVAFDDLVGAAPGFDLIDAPAIELTSLDVTTNAGLPNEDGGTISWTISGFPTGAQSGNVPPLTPSMLSTTGDLRLGGNLDLLTDLNVEGRVIDFVGNITGGPPADAALDISTDGKVLFGGDIGTSPTGALYRLTVQFEKGSSTTPTVQFTKDGAAQSIFVANDARFEVENASKRRNGVGLRTVGSAIATVGKRNGDLSITSNFGNVVFGVGEKLSVGGTATLTASAPGQIVRLSDASALQLDVIASEVRLARRATGLYLDRVGETQHDGGPSIVANQIRFNAPGGTGAQSKVVQVGSGKETVFGVPNPYDRASMPRALNRFPVFEIRPNGRPLTLGDFKFAVRGALASAIPILTPTGSSRSDLSGAFGPEFTPKPSRDVPDLYRVPDPARLTGLGVSTRKSTSQVQLARLRGAAIVDDVGTAPSAKGVLVSEGRLDARDAEDAIVLYKKLFGAEGDRAQDVREILQEALDRYLEETRARRVIGFELRRFVKNRPSTLIEAYQTLESLDLLFRYHRRLGLSPGEYRGIQSQWLQEIQPEGITLDELSEAIHPSRYVRGSDILDIFGR